jgi:hypothetical protein
LEVPAVKGREAKLWVAVNAVYLGFIMIWLNGRYICMIAFVTTTPGVVKDSVYYTAEPTLDVFLTADTLFK